MQNKITKKYMTILVKSIRTMIIFYINASLSAKSLSENIFRLREQHLTIDVVINGVLRKTLSSPIYRR